MDVFCPHCGEPWDLNEFHEISLEQSSSYEKVAAAFRKTGCPALGSRCGDRLVALPVVAEVYAMLGDDMDGAASFFEEIAPVHIVRNGENR